MIRVAVAGALGRMGRVACAAVAAQGDLALVGGLARTNTGEPLRTALGLAADTGVFYDDARALFRATQPDVVVDFTLHPTTLEVTRAAIAAGVSPVIGTTGWSAAEVGELAGACERAGLGACLVPNFAVGAVLMMRFAAEAARYFDGVEIVEFHHDQKRDAPSGTARLTAERIRAAVLRDDVPIHSVRLRGLVAHQEVLLGAAGEVLTIRHDALSREAFAGGIVLAIRRVQSRPGLTVGLDDYLDAARAEAVGGRA